MTDDKSVGPYQLLPFRPERNGTLDALRWAKKRLQIPILLEVDVTEARDAIRAFRRRTGAGLSFTAWVIGCVARAVADHPRVHAVRLGKRRMVAFAEVDVSVLVERTMDEATEADDLPPETLPMPAVIRGAESKSPGQIHAEIRRAQEAQLEPGASSLESSVSPRLQAVFLRAPAWIRDVLFWRWLVRSPWRIKRTMGTVVVTSVGMAAPGVLTWGIPLSLHPLAVGVGGIARRNTPEGTRDILALTVVFDHAVTDGAPVGRFVHRLHALLRQGYGLQPTTGEPPSPQAPPSPAT